MAVILRRHACCVNKPCLEQASEGNVSCFCSASQLMEEGFSQCRRGWDSSLSKSCGSMTLDLLGSSPGLSGNVSPQH